MATRPISDQRLKPTIDFGCLGRVHRFGVIRAFRQMSLGVGVLTSASSTGPHYASNNNRSTIVCAACGLARRCTLACMIASRCGSARSWSIL